MSRFATDLLRIIAANFIIFNHTTWHLLQEVATDYAHHVHWTVALVHQLNKPGVLFFIFLSGYAFAVHPVLKGSVKQFYANRLLRIVPPYLVLLGVVVLVEPGRPITWLTVLNGSFYFHLYFIPLILLLYLLFPLLNRLLNYKAGIKIVIGFFVVGFLMLAGLAEYPVYGDIYLAGTPGPEVRNAAVLKTLEWVEYLIFGVTVFSLGLWMGREREAVGAWSRKRSKTFLAVLALSGLIAVFCDFYYRLESGIYPDSAARIWRFTVLAEALVWVVIFFRFRRESTGVMRYLSRSTFLVYLIHPLILYQVRLWEWENQLLYLLPVAGISWVFALTLCFVARKNSYAAFFLGDGDRILGWNLSRKP